MKNLIVNVVILGLVCAAYGHAAGPQRASEQLLLVVPWDRLSEQISVSSVRAPTQVEMRGAMERNLGPLTAVERTYVLDVSDCQAQYKVRERVGKCHVQKFKRNRFETLGRADYLEQALQIPNDWSAYPNYYISIMAEVDGYSITVTQWWKKSWYGFLYNRDLLFDRVKRYIQQAIDKVPYHELKATVYLVQTDSH
jgi:hypothetical protein